MTRGRELRRLAQACTAAVFLAGVIGLQTGNAAQPPHDVVPLQAIGRSREVGPRPADRTSIQGDWIGIGDAPDILVTLRVAAEARGARVAITELQGGEAATRVYNIKNLELQGGMFRAGASSSPLEMSALLRRAYRTGWGEGTLIERRDGQPERRMQLQFFYDVGRAAAERLVQVEGGVLVPQATLVGESAWIAELSRLYGTAAPSSDGCVATP